MKKDYIEYVKSIYPEMIEDFWYDYGELHFYKNEYHKEKSTDAWACIKQNGKFVIFAEF